MEYLFGTILILGFLFMLLIAIRGMFLEFNNIYK